tara:strand:- start:325 stop:537 length:213 start_codon:yes stop_codon:yes gene_type:complete
MRLYDTEQPNGNRTFSGVINTDKKESLVMFDKWEHEIINNNIPVGINMLLLRNMEAFLDIPRANVNAVRL